MRYKTYFRRIMHNMAVEELPFAGTDLWGDLGEFDALRLVNNWNRLSNGTHQYWIA